MKQFKQTIDRLKPFLKSGITRDEMQEIREIIRIFLFLNKEPKK